MFVIIFAVFICVLFLWGISILPRIIGRPNMDDFNGKIFAHRGMFDNKEIPENSLAAFRKAVENGYGIELDIRLTSDDVPVVIHDRNLQRVCGINKEVGECTSVELKKYTLLGTNEKIPYLSQVLETVDGKVPLIIELKGESFNSDLCVKALEALENYSGKYCVESFNPILLRHFAKRNPKCVRGILSDHFDKKTGIFVNDIVRWFLQYLMTNFICRPDFIAYDIDFEKSIPLFLCRRVFGAKTFAWTVRNSDELRRAEKYFDSFICENIPTLKSSEQDESF